MIIYACTHNCISYATPDATLYSPECFNIWVITGPIELQRMVQGCCCPMDQTRSPKIVQTKKEGIYIMTKRTKKKEDWAAYKKSERIHKSLFFLCKYSGVRRTD